MDINLEIKNREKFIHAVINKLDYIPDKIEYEDLVQIGRESLWKALESFKDGCGYSLNTHCYNSIHGDILNYLCKHQRIKRKDITINESETIIDGIEDDVVGEFIFEEIKKHISESDYDLFIDKHINRLTHDELESKYCISKRTVIRRLEKIRQTLKDNLIWEK